MIITLIICAVVCVGGLGWAAIAIGSKLFNYYDEKLSCRVDACRSENISYTEDAQCKQYKKTRNKFHWAYYADASGWAATFCISLAIALFNGVIMLSLVSPRVVNKKYNNLVEERRVLELRLESQTEIGNEFLYNDIVKFNAQLRDYKADKANPWISWYYSDKICTISEIELTEEDMYGQRNS